MIHDPGDTVVTRSSLPGDYGQTLRAGFTAFPRMRMTHSVFLCERHQFLTGNAVFQNNLLHALLDSRRRPAQQTPL